MEMNIEKRGNALNDARDLQELLFLRHGLLKIYDPDTIYLKEEIFVNAHTVFTKADEKSIHIRAQVPVYYDATFKFTNAKETNSWLDAFSHRYTYHKRNA
jgi:hypothetical protein